MRIKISKKVLKIFMGLGGVILFFLALNIFIKAPSTGSGTQVNLISVFLTGLLTGGLTCLAVQGGLLAATLAQREEQKLKEKTVSSGNAIPILSFLLSKLLAYTILGMLLGWLGSLFTLSLSAMGIITIVVGVFMIGTALNMLNVHPIFRYFVIQPPRFLTRFVRKQSKSSDLFAPAIVGSLTVFIPCGTTQAMMALAIASANPWLGTLIMFSFVLGTSPVFFTLGYFTTKLTESLHGKFLKFAAVMIILISLYTMNNALFLTGSRFAAQNFLSLAKEGTPSDQQVVTEATITINDKGYSPQEISMRAGEKVKITFVNTNGLGCQQAFSIPQLNFQKIIRVGETSTAEVVMPKESGDIAFTCSMGMYTGVIHVI
ncbi:MAG: sulfite exporter TauE/SafE family protein [Patescibacteria group bacterium]